MPEIEHADRHIADELDCCDDPDIQLSDWKWDSTREGWNFDAMCHNCWAMCYGTIHTVDVEIRGESDSV
jgi:hypothetical protein